MNKLSGLLCVPQYDGPPKSTVLQKTPRWSMEQVSSRRHVVKTMVPNARSDSAITTILVSRPLSRGIARTPGSEDTLGQA